MVLQEFKQGLILGLRGMRLTKKHVDKHLRPYVRRKLLKPAQAKKFAVMALAMAKSEAKRVDNLVKSQLTQEIKKMGFVHKSELNKMVKK